MSLKSDKKEKQTLYRWIFSSYVRSAVVPLLIIQFIIVLMYFGSNVWFRQQMNQYFDDEVKVELEQITKSEGNAVQEQLTSITNATEMYRMMTLDALNTDVEEQERYRLNYSSEGVYYTTQDSSEGGAAIFYSGYYPIGKEGEYKVDQLLLTQNLMKKTILSQNLAASIYFNSHDALNIIYPYFDVLSQYAPLMDIPKYNFYYEADATYNPEKEVVWTDVYLDPAGHGWMVSSIAPVYNEAFLEGVVGIDVTVSNIINQILQLEIPYSGYGIMVGNDGTILALPSEGERDFGLNELTEHSYEQAILQDTFKPDDFNVYINQSFSKIATDMKTNNSGFSTLTINNSSRVVSWTTIEETGWKLLLIVEEEKVYEKVNETVGILNRVGWVLSIGLVVFYIIFIYFLSRRTVIISRNISKPLMDINVLLKKIGNGDYYQPEEDMDVQELEQTYKQLVSMGSQLGDSNRKLLETQDDLRNSEEYLRALINSIDDVIMEVDEFGNILNSWNKEDTSKVTELNDGHLSSINLLVDSNQSRKFIEKINRVIATGKSETIEYKTETHQGERWYLAKISNLNEFSRKAVVSARDISQRMEMEKSMLIAKTEAEKANKAKSTFLSNMSHELRTPLNAILGFAQILEMDTEVPLEEIQTISVQQILGAGKHLLALINEVLDLAKIESGKVMFSMEPIALKLVLDDTYSLIKPIAEYANIKFDTKYEGIDDTYIMADFTRIKQVLINLLTNAIKYNKADGSVNLSVELSKSKVQFHVIDSGIGIPKSELEQIFKPFYRLNTLDTAVEGTGIGLAVAKQLAELMDGNIFVESTVGVGSHFWVELNLANPASANRMIEHKTVQEHIKQMNNELHRIIYIEDNPANLALVERVIQNLPNVNLYTATTGEVCYDMAVEFKPSLILMDINLPGISEIDVMKLLKASELTKDIPVIAVSANAMPLDIEYALETGFIDYITKPINISDFLLKVTKILSAEK